MLRGTWYTDEGEVFGLIRRASDEGDLSGIEGWPHYDGALDEDTGCEVATGSEATASRGERCGRAR